MSRASKIYGTAVAKTTKPTTTNREGYPSYEKDIEEQYLQTLLTNTLGNIYYVKAEDLIAESEAIHATMLAKDPKFAAKALVYARNHGYMRTQPVYGLAQLSRVDPEAFKEVFSQVILTPNDLFDFMTIRGKSGSGAKTKAISNWLYTKMSEYWAIKYGSDKKQGFTLADVIKLTHPKGDNALFAYLLGKEVNLEELPQIKAFQALKKADTEDERIQAITEGRLPHEVVTPFANTQKIWETLVKQMPIFALLKNLAAIERHGAEKANKQFIQEKFANPEVIAKSKILPYRFLEAEKHVSASWLKDSLRDALELSFNNIPDIHGETCVMVDRSGSMSGQFMLTASIFGISLMKKTENGKMLLYDTQPKNGSRYSYSSRDYEAVVEEVHVSKRDSLLTQASKITARGGTDTAAPFQKITKEKYKVDNIILITDEQQNAGDPAYTAFAEYQDKVNRNTKLFIVDVSPYQNALFDPTNKNVYYIYGWSDRVLDFIGLSSQGWDSLADMIKNS
jgi:60 kDa SS-A/Ro ribonucleoprotein